MTGGFDPFGYQSIARALDRNTNALNALTKRIDHMAGELDALKAAVAAETTAVESAIVLLNGLKSALDAAIAAGDPAALAALSASIGDETAKLAAAVTANTPAAPLA